MGGRGYYKYFMGGLFARFGGGDWNHEVIFKFWWRGEDIFVKPEICKKSVGQTCKCISAKILKVKSAKFLMVKSAKILGVKSELCRSNLQNFWRSNLQKLWGQISKIVMFKSAMGKMSGNGQICNFGGGDSKKNSGEGERN